MKKNSIILFFLLLCTKSYGQNFGEQFMDWVMKDAAINSRELARNDFQPRTIHAINRINERMLNEIRLADSILNAVYKQIETDELAIGGLDTLSIALKRARSARTGYYNLLQAENRLYHASGLKLNMDSLGSNIYFYGSGLYNVGRETLMESYVKVGESFEENFALKYQSHYTVSFNVNMNDNSDANGGSASASQDGNSAYTSIGVTTGAAIGSAVPGIGTAIGAGVGLIVGFTADYFTGRDRQKKEQKKAEKEFKRQMKFLHQGIDSLQGQLVPVDTLLSYYKQYVKEGLAANKPLQVQLDSAFQQTSLRFRELFAYNVRRQQLSQQVLTVDQIAMIERNYMTLASLRSFYGNLGRVNFIRDCNLMINKLESDLNWLNLIPSTPFSWLQRKEAYQDDLKYAQLIVDQFIADESYYPYYSDLQNYKALLDSLSRSMPNPPERQIAGIPKGAIHSLASSLKSEEIMAMEQMVMPEALSLKLSSPPSNSVGICFGAGGYSLCNGMSNGSYGGQFNNGGQSPVTDILGSANDGGLRGFSAIAGRKISVMQGNITLRIKKLQDDHQQITNIMPQARQAYTQEANRLSASATQLGRLSAEKIRTFNESFDRQYPAMQQRLDSYMYQPLRTGLSNLQQDLGLTRQINRQIQQAEIPVSVFHIGDRNFGYEVPQGVSSTNLTWQREKGKQFKEVAAIEARVKAGNDPVFTTDRRFQDFKTKLAHVDQVLERNNSNGHYSHEVREKINEHYLRQVVKMRYAAMGQLPSADLEPVDFPFVDRDQRENLNQLVREIKQCNSQSGDCMAGYGKAIAHLYNDKSIVGLRNNTGEPFSAANLHQLVSNSSEWTDLGQANSQGSIGRAALQAMAGNTVIATRRDGFEISAGLVLPELPLDNGIQKWDGLQLPSMLYIDEGKPSSSFARGPISNAYPDPSEVNFYSRIKPRNYSNSMLRVQDKGVAFFEYNDPMAGDQASVPALQLGVQVQNGANTNNSVESIPFAGSYVERILNQYGSNSNQVFERLYSHRDGAYGRYPANPAGLTNQESIDLNALRQTALRFENRAQLLNKPEDFYYTQTSRCLYASCVASLSNALPAERSEILDYYNKVLSALVSYRDDALNVTTSLTPFVNDARDIYELVTGKDMITGVILTYWERGLSAGGLVLGSGAYWRYLSDLPQVRRYALDLADKGIPGVSMVKSGDLKYHFKSDEGIYYEPWNPLKPEGANRDRLTKIMEDHYSNPLNKTRFNVDHPYEIPALIDHAWKRAKDLDVKPISGNGGNLLYLVELEKDHPTVLNGGMKYIVLIFDGARKDKPFIITAYPKKNPIFID